MMIIMLDRMLMGLVLVMMKNDASVLSYMIRKKSKNVF